MPAQFGNPDVIAKTCDSPADFANIQEDCTDLCDGNWEGSCVANAPPYYTNACGFVSQDQCAFVDPSSSCSSFDPGDYISLVSGTYYVDHALVSSMINDPALWNCDDAYFEPIASPGWGFTLKAASSRELLYELGLRTNDVPLTLNGMELDNYYEVLTAYLTLWVLDGETDYDLAVKRGGNTVHLYYSVYSASP